MLTINRKAGNRHEIKTIGRQGYFTISGNRRKNTVRSYPAGQCKRETAGSGCCERKNVQMQVKEGDRIIFPKYAGTEVKAEEKEYTIVSQKDIIAIVQ